MQRKPARSAPRSPAPIVGSTLARGAEGHRRARRGVAPMRHRGGGGGSAFPCDRRSRSSCQAARSRARLPTATQMVPRIRSRTPPEQTKMASSYLPDSHVIGAVTSRRIPMESSHQPQPRTSEEWDKDHTCRTRFRSSGVIVPAGAAAGSGDNGRSSQPRILTTSKPFSTAFAIAALGSAASTLPVEVLPSLARTSNCHRFI